MAKPRKNAPALYELIGGRPRATQTSMHAAAHVPEQPAYEEEHHDAEQHRSLLSPGRTVRIPVGYFFFGLAVVIATGIGGYMLGHQQSEKAFEREQRRVAQMEIPSEPLDRPVNPKLLGGAGSMASGSPSRPAPKPSGAGAGGSSGAESGPGRLIIVGGDIADPRQRDVNYAVVASLGRERAESLARFLADQGLDVAVVKPNNVRLYSVVALRGFPSGTFRTDERRDFEARLKRLGDQYAALGGGRKNFAQLWWDRFD